jgi:hypothetical protein
MGGQKVYAVRKGHRTGVLDSWSECQAATNGYPGAPSCMLQIHSGQRLYHFCSFTRFAQQQFQAAHKHTAIVIAHCDCIASCNLHVGC